MSLRQLSAERVSEDTAHSRVTATRFSRLCRSIVQPTTTLQWEVRIFPQHRSRCLFPLAGNMRKTDLVTTLPRVDAEGRRRELLCLTRGALELLRGAESHTYRELKFGHGITSLSITRTVLMDTLAHVRLTVFWYAA